MGRNTNRKSFAPLIIFGLYMLLDTILIIVFSLTNIRYNATADLVTRVLFPLLSIPVIGFIGIMIQRIKTRRQEKRHKSDYEYLLENEEKREESKEIIQIVLEPRVFHGDLENQMCSICSMAVKDGQIILTCPECSSLFQHNHLLNWFKDNLLCPICDEDL